MGDGTVWAFQKTAIAAARISGLIVFLAGVSAAPSTPASAQQLFRDATPAEIRAASDATGRVSPMAIRHRLVAVNATVMTRNVAPAGLDRAVDRIARAELLGDTLVLNLFPDLSPRFKRTSISADSGSGYVWEGLGDRELFDALLVIDNGTISGRVQLKSRLFRIDHVAGPVHRVTELDPRKFPRESDATPRPSGSRADTASSSAPPREATAPAGTSTTTNTIVRVLFGYTEAALKGAGSTTTIIAEAKQAIALANQAYTRGKIPITLELAGTLLVKGYIELTFQQDLYNLHGVGNGVIVTVNASKFDALRAKRTQVKADLLSLLRSPDPLLKTCGIGFLPGTGVMPMPSAATREWGLSVVDHQCIPNLSVHHEFGHNMGLQHDRYIYKNQGGGDPSPSYYNFGYVNLTAKVLTIMSYPDACYTRGYYECVRINYFSSPTIRAQPGNVVIGIAAGKTGAADNTRRLIETRVGVSKYLVQAPDSVDGMNPIDTAQRWGEELAPVATSMPPTAADGGL